MFTRKLLPIICLMATASLSTGAALADEDPCEIADITWELGPNLPEFRKGGCATALGGKIVSVFGMRQPWGEMATMYLFDTKARQWERGPDGPIGQTYVQGAELGGAFYSIGGRSREKGGVHTLCYRLNSNDGKYTWKQIASLKERRGWAPSVSVDGKLYVFGGSQSGRGPTLSSVEMLDTFDPEPSDPAGTPRLRVAYAESSDGLHWSKPNLGLRTFQGSRENNLINPMGMMCLPDPHETDPEHKYKSAYSHWQQMKAAIAHSPDGLHWTPYNDGKPVTHRAADTINQLLWDPTIDSYRLYTRTDYQSKLRAKIEVRGTRDMINPKIKSDPTAWKTVREWSFDRPERVEYSRRQIYSLNGWIYEGVHFGLLWSYEWPGELSEGPNDLHTRHEGDIMNFYLLTTRGDLPWNLHWVYAQKPFIPRGPDGSFDKDWVQPAINIVTWNDKHWIYYAGSRERHDIKGSRPISIGLATLRLDGFTFFVSVHGFSEFSEPSRVELPWNPVF